MGDLPEYLTGPGTRLGVAIHAVQPRVYVGDFPDRKRHRRGQLRTRIRHIDLAERQAVQHISSVLGAHIAAGRSSRRVSGQLCIGVIDVTRENLVNGIDFNEVELGHGADPVRSDAITATNPHLRALPAPVGHRDAAIVYSGAQPRLEQH